MSNPTDEALAAAKETGEKQTTQKPKEYGDCCIVTKETPYKVGTGDMEGTHSDSGMLHRGRVVWVRERLPQVPDRSSVSAYAEGVGIVSVQAASLRHSTLIR